MSMIASAPFQHYEPSCINLFITNLCNRRCPFCYLNDWIANNESNAHHMSLKSLDALTLWLKKSKINKVKLAGGEPMLHPNLLDLIHKLMRNHIGIDAILTNGLGETELYEKVADLTKTNWLVNVTSPQSYVEDEWKLLNNNLEILKWKNENVPVRLSGFDTSSLRHLCLSITFYKINQDYRYIIELAKRYGVPVIRYDVSRPSSNRSNIHIDFDSLMRIKPTLMDFVRACVREEIKPGLDDALPFCVFTQEELKFLYLFSNFQSICMPVLDVMPDLTVEYCTSMRGLTPSYTIEDMTASKMFEELLIKTEDYRNFQLASCHGCYNADMKLCQSYCLRFKLDFLKVEKNELKKKKRWLKLKG
ncbi:MAG: radical SAM protein [Candidatus Bathyarchaeia archaeon]